MSTEERYRNFSIELDCAPGNTRPKHLIGGVLRGTGLNEEDFDTGDPFFGHQIWVLKESANKDALFTKAKPKFKKRIEKLYENHFIRYGTW
jgi:hypothetical protein